MAQVIYFYQEQVDAGVELLDRKEPGWALRVNLDQLGMSSLKNCVVGQLFGDWKVGRDQLGINGHSQMYGFNISYLSKFIGFITWPCLTAAWKMVIEERQRAHAAA